jgi:hypothetical protein
LKAKKKMFSYVKNALAYRVHADVVVGISGVVRLAPDCGYITCGSWDRISLKGVRLFFKEQYFWPQFTDKTKSG